MRQKFLLCEDVFQRHAEEACKIFKSCVGGCEYCIGAFAAQGFSDCGISGLYSRDERREAVRTGGDIYNRTALILRERRDDGRNQ